MTDLLIEKTNKAITDIFKANNYSESIPFNDPVKLSL